MQQTQDRSTRYTRAVHEALLTVGHATNAELLHILRQEYPSLSATTVHRITGRMLERHEIALGPSGGGNVRRFDRNTETHDHFMCTECDVVYDALLGETIRGEIEKHIGEDCSISGSLVVSGICKYCTRKEEK